MSYIYFRMDKLFGYPCALKHWPNHQKRCKEAHFHEKYILDVVNQIEIRLKTVVFLLQRDKRNQSDNSQGYNLMLLRGNHIDRAACGGVLF